MRKYIFLSIVLILGGCAADRRGSIQDASVDSSYGEAGAETVYDSGNPIDSGKPDSGKLDSGKLDSGKSDSGKPDSSIDASEPSEAGEPVEAGMDASEDASEDSGKDASEDSSVVFDQCPIPAPDKLDRFSVSTECDEPIVLDKRTGLVWTQHTELGFTWEEAIAYCSDLDYAGYADWRLPNEDELTGIYEQQIEPHSEFPNILAIKYWTSTLYHGPMSSRYGTVNCVNFGENSCLSVSPQNTLAVLCVRG